LVDFVDRTTSEAFPIPTKFHGPQTVVTQSEVEVVTQSRPHLELLSEGTQSVEYTSGQQYSQLTNSTRRARSVQPNEIKAATSVRHIERIVREAIINKRVNYRSSTNERVKQKQGPVPSFTQLLFHTT